MFVYGVGYVPQYLRKVLIFSVRQNTWQNVAAWPSAWHSSCQACKSRHATAILPATVSCVKLCFTNDGPLIHSACCLSHIPLGQLLLQGQTALCLLSETTFTIMLASSCTRHTMDMLAQTHSCQVVIFSKFSGMCSSRGVCSFWCKVICVTQPGVKCYA